MPAQYGSESRKSLLSGISQVADAVRVTLGPRGRNVCIEKPYGGPLVTKDGVSVAKEVELPDPWENMGAKLLIEVASKTSDDAGDGTTTATVLADELCHRGVGLVEAGYAPIAIKRGMDRALEAILEEVSGLSSKVNTQQDIENVATISANGDRTLGKIIADAVAKVGRDGVVNIEEGRNSIEVDAVDGMQFDRGWVRNEFSENGTDLSYENPIILVTDHSISAIRPLLPFLELVDRPLVIIAPDFSGEALPLFVQNHLQGRLKSCLIKAPGFGANQTAMLEDIAILTGAKFLTKNLGITFDSAFSEDPLQWVGTCGRIRVTAKDTTIIDGGGDQETVDQRAAQIRGEIERSGSEYDSDKLRERLGKLLGGICVIKVGASSELEMKELKARLEDALHATRASIDEGVVPGGGTTLIHAAREVEVPVNLSDDERAGFKLVLQACEAPLRSIVNNAGANGDLWVERVKESAEFFGVDATDMVIKNLMEAGVVDPTKVVRSSLTNAVSVSSTLLTTETMIRKPEKPQGA